MSNVLIIGKVWPESQSSAAGTRMMQLIEMLRSAGCEINFASTAARGNYSEQLEDIGINVFSIEVNHPGFDEFLRTLKPDIVIFDRFTTEEQFGWRVAEQCPDAIRILDTEDLHCLRAARTKAFKAGYAFSIDNLLTEEIAFREIASLLRSDFSIIISDFEMNILTEHLGIDHSLLLYLPLTYNLKSVSPEKDVPDFDERTGFISIGNFLHEPNVDAVQYLKAEIWPCIRMKLKNAEINIFGAYPSQKILQLHNEKEGFYVKGRAANALEVMKKARVHLAPLRFGAGLKGKIFDAMQTGTPSVTTPIGIEGISNTHFAPGRIEDDARLFADAAVSLYKNKTQWTTAQQNGFQILTERFDHLQFESALINKIDSVRNTLHKHRIKNFTGSMLRHHQNASTKYMSKWIEAKNRLS